ncbi:MAG TPA: cytochrome c [Vicinamibacterales bacterium]|nr:cytochrome c [Vicinamibacterales bacterium]
MKRIGGVLIAAAVLALVPALARAQDQAQVKKGMEVFQAQKCNVCHSIAGKGKKNGPLDDVGRRLSPADIRQWIDDPVAMTAKREPKSTRKPPMKKKDIPAADIDSLVAMLSTLKKT